ncbi:uncharacterized protein LOC100648625 [Bombus terrestris]|uniref:Uncharacterized protein LOC100648625 n=1 Tax=Bombus terrestris TaxID=30195 RepID=A0A9B0BVT1_BOMTE|nr:uncharacterized protein LOC100648625 [Bombus terrestris]
MRFSVVYKSGSDHRESDKGSTPISSELVFQTNNMEKGVLVFWIICLAIVIVDAKPFPQQESYDDEVLVPKDTIRYPNTFWLGRPFYDQDDYYGDNTYRKPSTLSYANVGAGWGR